MGEKDLSQYDLGSVLRSAHQFENDALRVTSANTSVPPKYSRVALTYNGSDSVTNAKFFEGSLAEVREITFAADSAGSLNNTYFTLYSENDESLYHVWYNVAGGGTDPAPVNSVGIEVPIETNDSAEIVLLATRLVLENKSDFKVEEIGPIKLKITNSRKGVASNTQDFGTGFTFNTVQQGDERLLKSVDIPFDGNTRYIFNTQEKKFEVESIAALGTVAVEVDAADGDNIAISRHENFRNLTFDEDYIDTDFTTNTYTEVLSYAATEDLKVRAVKAKADTLGTFRIKINGTISDYFKTSNFDRNCRFLFLEDLEVNNGDTISVEFVPERIRLSNYNFFFRIEAYV